MICQGNKTVYSSKSGSKSFDELDDLLNEKPRKSGSKRRGRRTQSSVSGADVMKAAERRQAAAKRRGGAPECRHSCDEVLTTSFHSAGHGESDSGSVLSSDCQHCVLNSLSNRTLSREPALGASTDRFISQRQYKRKIRREGTRDGGGGYSTLDLRTERKLSNSRASTERGASTRLVSKTTYKLKRFELGSDLDSAGEEKSEKSAMELMEVPLSPTHYEQPPTPEHDPPSPWEAECAIHAALSFLRSDNQPSQRHTSTVTEPWMLLSLDPSNWPSATTVTVDRTTSTRPSPIPKVPKGRALPDIPREDGVAPPQTNGHPSNGHDTPATPESEEESMVVLRPKTLGNDSIYQTIGGDDVSDGDEDSEHNRASKGSEASQSLSILSPFDEHEEWSKISQIINSFGADIGKQTEASQGRRGSNAAKLEQCNTPHNSPVYEYPTLKRREKLTSSLQEWLRYISMEKYLTNFETSGYDDISYMGGGVMTKEDLIEIGIDDPKDCTVLIDSLRVRENRFNFDEEGKPKRTELTSTTMELWLKTIGLSHYATNFR